MVRCDGITSSASRASGVSQQLLIVLPLTIMFRRRQPSYLLDKGID